MRMAFKANQFPKTVIEKRESRALTVCRFAVGPFNHIEEARVHHGEDMSYTVFQKNVDKKLINAVQIGLDDLVVDGRDINGASFVTHLPRGFDIDTLVKKDVDVRIEPLEQDSFKKMMELGSSILTIVIQLVIFGVFGYAALSVSRSSSSKIMGITDTVVGEEDETQSNTKTTFEDVAGMEGPKNELIEIVTFMKDRERFESMGATLPKGVLLTGPPGTGKTLLARALAGEAGVPFYFCSGSEFVQVFVGVGAARIRETFKKARANAPCIIFIDEIDAIGKERSSSNMGSNSEQEQTMNQILTEMDGFKSHEGVLVIAATNRKEVLDPALVRSGRFDRHVDVPVPSRSERLDILELYAKDKKLSADVDLDLISGWTSGMVGADLKNLLNEAAILSTINDLEEIPQEAIEISLDKLQLGIENNCDMTDQERNVIAYHEAGHALLGALVNEFDTLTRVSIVPRGDAGGITMFQPDEKELQLYSQQYLLNKLIVLLGGRIAEEHAFGKLQTTTGASADLQAVHEIAHTMVSVLGFNETLGPVAWDENVGEIVSNDIDAEIKQIVNWAYRQGKELIEANEFYLKALANALLENDTLYTDDIMIALEGLECPWMKRMEIEDDIGSEVERDEGESDEGESEEGRPIPPALVRKLKRLEGDI